MRQGGGGWNQAGASNRNTSDNWVEYSDVTQFSPWTLSSLAPSTGFAQWRTEFFTPAELADPAISGDLADPDHDRLVNLMEYALHLDPTRPSSAGSPYLEKSPASLSLIYTKVIGATDLIYAVEKSSDLIKWAPASPVDLILSDDGVTQTIRAQVPTLGVARMDLRLRVSN